MSYRSVASCLLSVAFVVPAFAGSVLEFATTEYGQGEPILGTVQMTTDGADTRLEIISVTSAEAGGLIFHGATSELIILDHLQGNYIVIDQPQMDAIAGQVGAAMAQMREALEGMPPEQRAMAEQMMQRQVPTAAPEPSPFTINHLGSRGEVAGVPCESYEVLQNGRKVRELCVSDWGDLEGGQETAAALRGVADFFEEMRKAFAGAGGMDVFDRQRELFDHMSELDGYPILSRDFAPSGALRLESKLTAARRQDVNPDFFQPPVSYTPQEMPQGMN